MKTRGPKDKLKARVKKQHARVPVFSTKGSDPCRFAHVWRWQEQQEQSQQRPPSDFGRSEGQGSNGRVLCLGTEAHGLESASPLPTSGEVLGASAGEGLRGMSQGVQSAHKVAAARGGGGAM